MAAETSILLPGDPIPSNLIPTSKKPLKLGPGLQHTTSPHPTLTATLPGTLTTDPKKNALWLETPSSGRYTPSTGDLVIGTIARSSGEYYYVSLSPYTSNVILPHLAFEGATKKTRPQLHVGDIIYARVKDSSRQTDSEIECVNSNTGKAEGMGPLKGGMVFDVSTGFARRLMMSPKKGGVLVLGLLSEKVGFEVAVGRNGRVWVSAESVGVVVLVGRALRVVDEEGLDEEGQRGLCARLLRGL